MTGQPVRHTVDTITSDALDQLYAEREKYGNGWNNADRKTRVAEAALAAEVKISRDLLKQRQEMAAERYAWQERGDQAEARAEQAEHERDTACRAFNEKALRLDDAEAAITRIRALADDLDANNAHGGLADGYYEAARRIREALDEPKQPRP